ncbi:MAG: YncE family protein [Flavipsychrobacter sp.]
MKKIFTLFFLLTVAIAGYSQPTLCSGFGFMGGIDGTTYTRTTTFGTHNYQYISAANDGSQFYAASFTSNKLYWISTSFAITDSMNVTLYDIASSNEANTLFGLTQSSMYRINTTSKSVTDSIAIANPFRLEERPGAKEVWVSGDSMIYVVDYTSGLTKSSIHISNNAGDYYNVRFTKGGTLAYKIAAASKKIFKIDALTKTKLDSANLANANGYDIEVSTDSSKIFVSMPNDKKIMIYQASNMALVDSIVSPREVFSLYRHPSRKELWAVNHFQDSITVYDEDTKATIAVIPAASSPFHLAFAKGSVSVTDVPQNNYHLLAYPNPATNELFIKLPNGNPHRLIISGISGQIISIQNETSNRSIIQTDKLIPGSYQLSVYEGEALKSTIRFVKQ